MKRQRFTYGRKRERTNDVCSPDMPLFGEGDEAGSEIMNLVVRNRLRHQFSSPASVCTRTREDLAKMGSDQMMLDAFLFECTQMESSDSRTRLESTVKVLGMLQSRELIFRLNAHQGDVSNLFDQFLAISPTFKKKGSKRARLENSQAYFIAAFAYIMTEQSEAIASFRSAEWMKLLLSIASLDAAEPSLYFSKIFQGVQDEMFKYPSSLVVVSLSRILEAGSDCSSFCRAFWKTPSVCGSLLQCLQSWTGNPLEAWVANEHQQGTMFSLSCPLIVVLGLGCEGVGPEASAVETKCFHQLQDYLFHLVHLSTAFLCSTKAAGHFAHSRRSDVCTMMMTALRMLVTLTNHKPIVESSSMGTMLTLLLRLFGHGQLLALGRGDQPLLSDLLLPEEHKSHATLVTIFALGVLINSLECSALCRQWLAQEARVASVPQWGRRNSSEGGDLPPPDVVNSGGELSMFRMLLRLFVAYCGSGSLDKGWSFLEGQLVRKRGDSGAGLEEQWGSEDVVVTAYIALLIGFVLHRHLPGTKAHRADGLSAELVGAVQEELPDKGVFSIICVLQAYAALQAVALGRGNAVGGGNPPVMLLLDELLEFEKKKTENESSATSREVLHWASFPGDGFSFRGSTPAPEAESSSGPESVTDPPSPSGMIRRMKSRSGDGSSPLYPVRAVLEEEEEVRSPSTTTTTSPSRRKGSRAVKLRRLRRSRSNTVSPPTPASSPQLSRSQSCEEPVKEASRSPSFATSPFLQKSPVRPRSKPLSRPIREPAVDLEQVKRMRKRKAKKMKNGNKSFRFESSSSSEGEAEGEPLPMTRPSFAQELAQEKLSHVDPASFYGRKPAEAEPKCRCGYGGSRKRRLLALAAEMEQ